MTADPFIILAHWFAQWDRWRNTNAANPRRLSLWIINDETSIDVTGVMKLVELGYARVEHGGPATFGHTDYFLTDAGIEAGRKL